MILKDLPIGTIVTDKKTKFNGKPIEWFVADHEKYPGGTVLLSKDILCCRPFDKPKKTYEDADRRESGSNRWRDSYIRNWLETIFAVAFSNQLADLTICISNTTELPECDRIDKAEEKTKDDLFLLSEDEVGYADYNKALQLFRCDNRDKYRVAEACLGLKWYWWLRSPRAGYSYNVCDVNGDGSLVNCAAYYGYNGVRPACVISDSAPIKEKKNRDYRFDRFDWTLFKFDWNK